MRADKRKNRRGGSRLRNRKCSSNSKKKVALITGGSEGIGRATAFAFAEHGARVTMAARRLEVLEATAQELRKSGARVLPVVADVTNPASPLPNTIGQWRIAANVTDVNDVRVIRESPS